MSLKDESRKEYGIWGSTANTDELQAGCLQRIADSLERMEQPFRNLLEHNEYLKSRLREEQAAVRHLHRRIACLRGVITKMKGKGR